MPGFRAAKDAEWDGIAAGDEPFYAEKRVLCDMTQHEYTTKDGATLTFYLIIPKALDLSQKHPGYIYAHGGGGVMGTAEQVNDYCCITALNLNCCVFNVNYRLGPEVKCPTGMQDFIDCLKLVHEKAEMFSVDTSRVCIAGLSGGGWIVAGAANILAKEGEIGLVKAMFIHTGQLSDETASIPEDQLEKPAEYWLAPFCTATYKLHATDFEAQQDDDLLYPGKASDDLLAKLPMTAVWTSEFDFFKRDNLKYAERLRAVGKLIDVSNMPGMTHGYQITFYHTDENKGFFAEEKLAFDAYVANN